MPSLFSLPFVRRKMICVGISLVVGIVVATSLPADLVAQVPFVRAAAFINALIIGAMLTFAGFVTWNPILKMRIHPLLRGAAVAALVHLDYIVYTWGDQRLFWTTFVIAAVYGAILDMVATRFGGEGTRLLEGVTR